MSVTHFYFRYSWWCFPLTRFLRRLGVSRTRAAKIIAYGIHVRAR